MGLLDDVTTAVTQIGASRDQIVADAAILLGLVEGPAAGAASTVDAGGSAGILKTLARVLAEAAGRVGLQYGFSSETDTTADPGAGTVAFNNAALASVTEIAISAVDANALNLSGYIETWDQSTNLLVRGHLVIQTLDSAAIAVLHVNAAMIDGAGFYRLSVVHDGSAGAFADAADISVQFVRAGDKGGQYLAIPIFDPGKPISGEVLWSSAMPKPCIFLAGMTESYGLCKATPAADAVFGLWHAPAADPTDLTLFATATFLAGARIPTYTLGADEEFAEHDVFEVTAPNPLDATLSGASLTAVAHMN
ncbi:MAG: hypothetical protein GC182_03215 [Rhodopseudomonas sp.]|nr:hypothetical protein [Rhodopseudomonas sp.]